MASNLGNQSLEMIRTAAICLFSLSRFFYLSFTYILRGARPDPTWTFRQACGNALLKASFDIIGALELKIPHSLEKGAEGEQFVTISPAEAEVYDGLPLLPDSEIRPTTIGGVWYPRAFDKDHDKDAKVILHFRGGGYIFGSPRKAECGFTARTLLQDTSALALFPQYRLASNKNGSFPAALQDAISAYVYLLSLGISPSTLILSGDSAGGHLVLSLLRFISDSKTKLPDPRAVLLWSPWLNLARNPQDFERHRNVKTDFVGMRSAEWAVRVFVPPALSLTDPYISPVNHFLNTKVPIWTQVGGNEVLCDDGITFAQTQRDGGHTMVGLYKSPNAPHDILLLGHILGFQEEAAAASRAAWKFLDNLVVKL